MKYMQKVEELLSRPVGQLPTQQNVNNLYHELDSFVVQAIKAADGQHLPLLIIIGETHTFGHNSVLIETMLLDITKRQEISNLFLEGNQDFLEECLENPPGVFHYRYNEIDDLFYGQVAYTTVNHANNSLFKIIPTELSEPWLSSIPNREKEMIATMVEHSSGGNALSIFGASHLMVICQDPLLNSHYLIKVINTVPIEFNLPVEIIQSEERQEFLHFSEEVARFRLAGDFFHAWPSELLRMAKIADATFVKPLSLQAQFVSCELPLPELSSRENSKDSQCSSAEPKASIFLQSIKTTISNIYSHFFGKDSDQASPVSVIESTVHMLQTMVEDIEVSVGDYVQDVVASCPSYFPPGAPQYWQNQSYQLQSGASLQAPGDAIQAIANTSSAYCLR